MSILGAVVLILALALFAVTVRSVLRTVRDHSVGIEREPDGAAVSVIDLEARRVAPIPPGLKADRTNKTLDGKRLPRRRLGGR